MKCPYCAEDIKDEAIACRWCGRDFLMVKPLLQRLQEVETEITAVKLQLHELMMANIGTPSFMSSQLSKSESLRYSTMILSTFAATYIGLTLYSVYVDWPDFLQFFVLLTVPLAFGIVLGIKVSSGRPLLRFFVGIAVGIASLVAIALAVNRVGELWTTNNIYPKLAIVVAPALLLLAGSFFGRWVGRKSFGSATTTSPSFIFALRHYTGKGLSTEDEARKTKKLADLIAAFAPLLTFLASVAGAYLTYLGTIAKEGIK